jgi:hypothetical protein
MLLLVPPGQPLPFGVDDDSGDDAATPADVRPVTGGGVPVALAAELELSTDADPADRPGPGEALAVRPSPACPSCGRSHAVVFPLLRPGVSAGAPFVCLGCCPKMANRAGGRAQA